MKYLGLLLLLAPAHAAPLWSTPLPDAGRDLSVEGSAVHVIGDAGGWVSVEGGKITADRKGAYRAIATGEGRRWMAGSTIVSASLVRAELAGTVDLAAGYGPVAFALTGRVLRVEQGKVTALSTRPAQPTTLALAGGRMVVGAADGLHWVSLKDGATSELAKIGAVEGVIMDHRGHFVATTAKGVKVVTPAGVAKPLALRARGQLAFAGRTLYSLSEDRRTLHAHDYAALIGEDAKVWAARDARVMRPFTDKGVSLTGGEYWPNRGVNKTKYPDDVLWGFYPEKGVVFEGEAAKASATPAAVACAERSFAALKAFIASDPVKLKQAAQKVPFTSARFYLWVNDYSEASAEFPHPVRWGRLWYWQRKPQVTGRIPGYWKWETTLTRAGECEFPKEPQISKSLDEKLAK